MLQVRNSLVNTVANATIYSVIAKTSVTNCTGYNSISPTYTTTTGSNNVAVDTTGDIQLADVFTNGMNAQHQIKQSYANDNLVSQGWNGSDIGGWAYYDDAGGNTQVTATVSLDTSFLQAVQSTESLSTSMQSSVNQTRDIDTSFLQAVQSTESLSTSMQSSVSSNTSLTFDLLSSTAVTALVSLTTAFREKVVSTTTNIDTALLGRVTTYTPVDTAFRTALIGVTEDITTSFRTGVSSSESLTTAFKGRVQSTHNLTADMRGTVQGLTDITFALFGPIDWNAPAHRVSITISTAKPLITFSTNKPVI